ncbi:hypothetical protein AO263_20885 [Pseudomonas sp. NZIPFR-PS5]|nr:hypothetical protein AO263_20885 [Pseudomonas sp. NZIPFR-PS5]
MNHLLAFILIAGPERLPEDARSAGLAAAEEWDVYLYRYSGIVYPAAELPLCAWSNGATVVHIHPVRLGISSQEHFLQGPTSVMTQTLLHETSG